MRKFKIFAILVLMFFVTVGFIRVSPHISYDHASGPTSGDDRSGGYRNGHTWITTDNVVYVCADCSVGSAQWGPAIGVSGVTVIDLTVTGSLRVVPTSSAASPYMRGALDLKSGTENIFIGEGAGGTVITSANDNIGIGGGALDALTDGKFNIGVGNGSLSTVTSADNNVAGGYFSLNANIVDNNTAYGYQSLRDNTTGTPGTAVGRNALRQNTKGISNTALGAFSLDAMVELSYSTAVGHNALTSAVSGYNTAAGYAAGETNTIGENNTYLGRDADADAGNYSNSMALGANAVVTSTNHVRIGDSGVTRIGGEVAWTTISDIRTKSEIEDSDLGLAFVVDLRPRTFLKDNSDQRIDGLIAQEVKETMDKLDVEFSGWIPADSPDGLQALSYGTFVVPLINAIQEQQRQIEELKEVVILLMKAKEN